MTGLDRGSSSLKHAGLPPREFGTKTAEGCHRQVFAWAAYPSFPKDLGSTKACSWGRRGRDTPRHLVMLIGFSKYRKVAANNPGSAGYGDEHSLRRGAPRSSRFFPFPQLPQVARDRPQIGTTAGSTRPAGDTPRRRAAMGSPSWRPSPVDPRRRLEGVVAQEREAFAPSSCAGVALQAPCGGFRQNLVPPMTAPGGRPGAVEDRRVRDS